MNKFEIQESYKDIRTACNALKYICEHTQDYRFELAVDLEYGNAIGHEYQPYDNGGYPVMFIKYDKFTESFWYYTYNAESIGRQVNYPDLQDEVKLTSSQAAKEAKDFLRCAELNFDEETIE